MGCVLTCCQLFVDRGVLFVVCYIVVCCWLFVVWCLLFVCCRSRFDARCAMFVVYLLFVVVRCLLSIELLFGVCRLLCVVCCLPLRIR